MNNKLVKAYKDAFETEAGKLVLTDLAAFCGHLSTTYVQGDPYSSAHKEGMRRVFLRVLSYLSIEESDLRKLVRNHTGEFYE